MPRVTQWVTFFIPSLTDAFSATFDAADAGAAPGIKKQ
jgi:hypothetical protein